MAYVLALFAPAASVAQTMSQERPAVSPAQTAPTSEDDEASEPTTTVAGVTVTAHRLISPPQPGAVVGDIKPELQFGPADIQSYGVSTVTELLEELAPEIRSDRGRGGESPVILLNGRRISGFNEIQNIPTEAILRVDILPEEVSLKYGYSADQRVVNIVLRRRFRAITGELQGGGPTEGGRESGQAEADLLHIRGDNRLNLDLKYQGASEITEAARGIVEPAPASLPGMVDIGEDLASARTLAPATQSLTGNAVLARPIPGGINATVNATLGATTSQSLQGLPSVNLTVPADDPFATSTAPVVADRYLADQSPLRQSIDGWTAHLGSTLNRDLSDWRLSLTDAYDHAESETHTDVGVDPAPLQALLDAGSPSLDPFATTLPAGLIAALPQDRSSSVSDAANIQVLANGSLLDLPTGQLYVSAKAGDTQSWLASRTVRLDDAQSVVLSRNDVNAQLNMDLPIASRDHHVLSFLGELSLNANAAIDRLSDYGVLKTFGYGVNWTPVAGVNLIVSHTNDQAAPTIQQLGAPLVLTPDVRVFDYQTGQSVDVAQVTGGNSALLADNRNVFKVGLTLKPFSAETFTITANFIKSDIDHPIETFPAADATIQSAFPDRFIRDPDGDLIEEDERPVSFARSERSELRWGFNYSHPIGPQPPPRPFRGRPGDDGAGSRPPGEGSARDQTAGAQDRGAPPDASVSPPSEPDRGSGRLGGGRGGGGRGRGGFGPGGRFQIAVYHTVYFTDRMLVRPGGPVLDLLNGAAASSTGGQYRNEIEAQAGMTLLGFGARLSADWRSATFVQGGAGSATGDLFFSDITTINLRLFDNLGQQPPVVKRYPWLRGARVTLNVTNLFDQRVQVHDGSGATPISYQPGYIDPVGRAVTLSIRKLFF